MGPADIYETGPSDVQVLHQFVAKSPESMNYSHFNSKKSHFPDFWGVLGVATLWVR